jgi:NAD(P)-dependent dehydrogenase (short-subunit alcohol dehydrogenase family)
MMERSRRWCREPWMARDADRAVAVTGASRGLGRGCALAFAGRGTEVALIARGAAELESVAEEVRACGGSARVIECDVTRDELVHEAFAALGRCDILINNAGMNRPQPFLEVDAATLDALLALNVRSMFVTAQAAARLMARRRSGVIINMSSQMGHVGAAGRTVYCMTKHAIEGLTKAMAVELAPLGIRVNSVAPTYIETPMTRPFFEDASFREDVLRRIPLGRTGSIQEVAAAVAFLASSAASLITGTSLVVDGGYTAQ